MSDLLQGDALKAAMLDRARHLTGPDDFLTEDLTPLIAAELAIAYLDGATAALHSEMLRIRRDALLKAKP